MPSVLQKGLVAPLCLLLAVRLAPAQSVVIGEIHYDPPDNTSHEEFVELHNPTAGSVDVSGWFFSAGIDFTFPPGASIPAGGFVVVAEDPDGFARRFGRPADHGPWEGRLDSSGERLTLRTAQGLRVDEVDWSVGFPWPTASAGDGASMERIHPSLPSDLGGSWRASGSESGEPRTPVTLVASRESGWRYFKGTAEPTGASGEWRHADYSVTGDWIAGRTSIGYGDGDDSTTLPDMPGNYSSIYLRRVFPVDDPADLRGWLRLRVYVDDGCVVWINGIEVGRFHVGAGELRHDDLADSHEAEWEAVEVGAASSLLVPGDNVLAVHVLNQAIDSSDLSFDAELSIPGADAGASGPPTPGAVNSVRSENAPPLTRQVQALPARPPSGTPFVATAKVTDPDGVASVRLSYQVVAPGAYIPAYLPLPHSVLLADPRRARDPNPAFEDPGSWTELEMRDDGAGGDEVSGDDVWSVTIPGQANRTLVRWRVTVEDAIGATTRVPYPDDPSLNFACFVYDGVPGYRVTRRTVRPEGIGYEYPPEVMRSLAVYHLIAREQDIIECIAASSSLQIPQGTDARFIENWEGAFVYEDDVYDHVTFRLRGANGRYQVPSTNPGGVAGKRHWRFKFNKGQHLRARDRYGNRHPTRWRVLNTGRMFGNRLDGNWGLGDQVNDVIWNAYGVPAVHGHSFHFRVVDGASEAPDGVDGQYHGDFWGIARAFENYDVRFLEAHGLAKGNLYKLVNQTQDAREQQRYQAPWAVDDGSDHDNIEDHLRASRTDQWLRDHVDWPRWYRYHAVAQAIRHYDYWPSANKNAAWYFEPDYTAGNGYLGRMWTLPFDADATWGPTWNAGMDRPYDAIHAGSGKPDFQLEYRNHIREVRDLLWQRDQLEIVIRQVASFIHPLEEADIDRWRSAPAEAGRQYFSSTRENRLAGKVDDMLTFAFVGGSWPGGGVGAGGRASDLDSLADEPEAGRLPERPEISYEGPDGFPIDGLTVRCSPFSDPQGEQTFGAMEWRLAEVAPIRSPSVVPLDDPVWREAPLPLEISPVWSSGQLDVFSDRIEIPPRQVRPGGRYRARVRTMDDSGRWSHWSRALDFVAGEPTTALPVESWLRISELMYHPADDGELEFVELVNTGPTELDIRGVAFTDGIDFRFEGSDAESIAPGERLLVVRDPRTFEARFDTTGLRIAGAYGGALDNGGERLALTWGGHREILAFEYDDVWFPTTDGEGRSLEVLDETAPRESWSEPGAWAPSEALGGTPGRPRDSEPPVGGWQRPGDANQDGVLDLSDAIGVLRLLFVLSSDSAPCEGESPTDGGNLRLLDVTGDGGVDISDAVALLGYLFLDGPPPAAGVGCRRIEGCPDVCF